jgi:hypothetical protein
MGAADPTTREFYSVNAACVRRGFNLTPTVVKQARSRRGAGVSTALRARLAGGRLLVGGGRLLVGEEPRLDELALLRATRRRGAHHHLRSGAANRSTRRKRSG